MVSFGRIELCNLRNAGGGPKQTTTYTLETVNAGGCISRDKVTVFVFATMPMYLYRILFRPTETAIMTYFIQEGKEYTASSHSKYSIAGATWSIIR